MSAPIYKLKIIRISDGAVVQLTGGGTLEVDLIQACTDQIVAKGVGFLKTRAHVESAIATGIHEVFDKLKQQSIYAQDH